jgi:hypothetical protein
MRIIGRQAELKTLARLAASPRPEFIAVYGRRRVGKTYLIREYFQHEFCFAFTGRSKATTQEQLAYFADAVAEYSQEPHPLPGSWREAFHILRAVIEDDDRPGKKVVFLDKMPWMATDGSGFLESLGHFWNSWAATRPDLLLIVCGSAASWMSDKLTDDTGGLHNRVTGTLSLSPFTLAECEELFDEMGVVLGRYQILEAAMIFGGIPYYLHLFAPGTSLAQNVDALCFTPQAPLRHEFPNLYASLFANDDRHIAIVTALAGKNRGMTRRELIAATGLSNGGRLTKILTDLDASGFIRVCQPFGKKQRDSLYQLTDPFSLFALRFMVDRTRKESHFWQNYSPTPMHAAWSGYAFEGVALLHVEQIRRALGISGVLTSFASWVGEADGESAQIDLVLDRNDRIVNLCEMKYSVGPIAPDAALEREILRKRALFHAVTRTRKAVHSTLVTTYDPVRTKHSDVFQSIVTMDDLFRPR